MGAWANSTAYATDDVVTTGGKTYICILGYTSAASPGAFAVGSNWSLMAEKGTDGTDLTTTLSTAGDIVYKGASALTRLAKGTADQVLTMNTGATAPVWAAAAGGANTPAFRAYVGGNMYPSDGVTTKVALSQDYDSDGCYDTSNYRFTPTTAGYYSLFGSSGYSRSNDPHQLTMYIRFNGVLNIGYAYEDHYPAYAGYSETLHASALHYFNGTSDYVELWINYQEVGAGAPTITANNTYFLGFKIIT
jgi:hypothetical protein